MGKLSLMGKVMSYSSFLRSMLFSSWFGLRREKGVPGAPVSDRSAYIAVAISFPLLPLTGGSFTPLALAVFKVAITVSLYLSIKMRTCQVFAYILCTCAYSRSCSTPPLSVLLSYLWLFDMSKIYTSSYISPCISPSSISIPIFFLSFSYLFCLL